MVLWEMSSPVLREMLRQILDGTPAAVGVLDTELRYLYVNPTLARMNGLPAEEHLGRTVAEVVPDVDARYEVLRTVLADGRPRETVSSGHTRADSPLERRFWHGAYHRLEHGGKVLGLVGVLLEISADRQQRRELERVRERLALLDEAATRIGTTLDMDTTCQELASFLVEHLADGVGVDVLPEPGTVRAARDGLVRLRRAAEAIVPEVEALLQPLSRLGEYVDYQPESSVACCLATGEPVIVALPGEEGLSREVPVGGGDVSGEGGDVSAEEGEEGAEDAFAVGWRVGTVHRVALLRAAGVHSMMIVPLSARGHDVGTVNMIRAQGSPPFAETDAVMAQDLAQRAAISLDNARRYTAEHNTVVHLQRALLSDPGTPCGGVEVAYRYRPAGQGALVGGDWYETVALGDGRTLLAVGDVMGHGLDAAVAMSRYQAMLRVAATVEPVPGRILRELDVLLDTAGEERPATCVIAIADPGRGVCSLASAGHLPPVLFGPGGRAAPLRVPPGPPLGVGRCRFETVVCPYGPGDTLLLYTDGLIERRHEDIDTSLLRLTHIPAAGPCTPDQLLDHLLSELAPAAPEDDIALVAARATS
ncbi:SpoIIE family protein phosphatase [Streptomyces ipomoeae]|uniref:PAS domain S-box n=1 Tax=Streptomyces ipomoeae 91-03 TaxID=698759 RepID=L1KRY1_9ACTN|nr:SpoIIE family protein phosphatase [Streptomyces ipomoeae]EKX63284.1 PAS domain S-box [Streptomyces ipomoeae 91-03]MDX2698208.1 SpoIIE family protein phosphatase [Streptomyces ipomoeae]MDX2842403.1 SpoIIE family protein phosphatase [Streptomyces ipomoeae]